MPAEKDAESRASEWQPRERRGREEERKEKAEELNATGELGVEELPPFLPTPSFMAPADED